MTLTRQARKIHPERREARVTDASHPSRITRRAILKEIYATCEREGRIAYKHGKGSRLLTANEHWKSQIRHALYTSPRFKRVDDGEAWSVSNPEAKAPEPVTVGKRPPCPSLSLSLSL